MVLLLLASLPQAAANGPCARYAEAVLLVLLRRGANCETSGAAAAAAAAAASRLLLLRPPPPPPPPLIGGKAAEPVEDYDYQIIQQLLQLSYLRTQRALFEYFYEYKKYTHKIVHKIYMCSARKVRAQALPSCVRAHVI